MKLKRLVSWILPAVLGFSLGMVVPKELANKVILATAYKHRMEEKRIC